MRHFKNLVLVLGILLSLFALVHLYSLISLLLLVPWDVSFVRPDVGTWQRSVNDFFESRPGEILTYGFYTVFFASMTFYTLRKRWEAALRVMVANLIAAFGLFPVTMLSFPISQFLFPFGEVYTDPFFHNYTRNLLPMALLILMIVWWLRELHRLQNPPMKAKNKAKNQSAAEAASLLHLSESQAEAEHEALPAQARQRLSNS